MKAARGERSPKNKIDHRILKINWALKTINALLTPSKFIPFCQIRNNAMPISKNKAVQTGPNSQAGGLNAGFLSEAYQVGIDLLVKIAPIIPAN